MPNQRADNKKQFTAALDRKLVEKLDAIAAKLGTSRTELLSQAAKDFLAALESQNEEQGKN